MKKRVYSIITLLVFFSMLFACGQNSNSAVTTPAAGTETPAASTTPTQAPSDTPVPSDTPIPTATPTPYNPVRYTRQAEDLGRGLTAVVGDICTGTVVSWRSLGTDSADVSFTLSRNGEVIAQSIKNTCFNDTDGKAGDVYTLEVFSAGTVSAKAQNASCIAVSEYINVPIQVPGDDTLRMGGTCKYYANDASVGDVDGDGEYEIILKWDPDNAKDNSQNGITGRVYIDCYKLDGTMLWRINLGENIRAGAHYTQFMVYDFDGDGKAEMICKTGDGSIDGRGTVIGDEKSVYLNTTIGKILRGPEYLTLFDGETGAALDTIDFEPERGKIDSWGDSSGNRSERYLGAVAYLDGKTPSCIMSRGYYARTAICAYNVVDKKLQMLWKFDTDSSADLKQYMGQGNHNLAVADVDGDGFDELCFGQLTIDEDGTAKACTGLGHGDAMHVGDLVLDHPGVEAWSCLEGAHGAVLWNPCDADILHRINASGDTGRGTTGNFVAGNRCYEFVSSESRDVFDSDFNVVATWPEKASVNYAVYWDGDLEHEVGDGTRVYSIDGDILLNAEGCVKINGTKSNTSLTADILGDWREEIILPSEDRTSLRIYLSPYSTDVSTFTLMHDIQYRCQVASQNVAYNQGALTSFFLGTGFDLPEKPDIYTVPTEK